MGGLEAGAHDQPGDLGCGPVFGFRPFLCLLFLYSYGYQPRPTGEGWALRQRGGGQGGGW